jgi:hypothetical protein
LTNALSKKLENHSAAVALGYFAYNFITIHRTPAMAAGVTDRLWEVSDLGKHPMNTTSPQGVDGRIVVA